MEQLDAIATPSGNRSKGASNALSRIPGVVQGNMPGPGTDNERFARPFNSPTETHWTRILHYDLVTGRADDSAADPDGLSTKEPRSHASESMARSSYAEARAMIEAAGHSSGDERSNRVRPSIVVAAILFAICVAMYLDTSGVAHGISTNAAAAPDRWLPTVHAGSATDFPVDAGQFPPSGPLDRISESIDNARECRPAAIDSNCIYG